MMMRSILPGFFAMLLVTAGCATVGNTPAQDLAWERWKACDHFSMITLVRIELDGRLVVTVVTGNEYEAAPFTACVREAAAGQVRRGASGATAAVLVRTYGCRDGAM
jgi:hypothetical protein